MSATHAMYAKKICEHIQLMYGVKLKKYNLIYGSIKPDISMLFPKHPHYINESLDNLCCTADMLIESTENKYEIETRAFSRELGVVLHYVTDFFCMVHNDVNGKKHPTNYRHVVYEQNFQNKLKTYELDEVREDVANRLPQDIQKIESTSLKDYIVFRHKKYMKEIGKSYLYNSYNKKRNIDINYSFGMSIEMASYIINSILSNKKGK